MSVDAPGTLRLERTRVGHYTKDRALTHLGAPVYVGRAMPRMRLAGSPLGNPFRVTPGMGARESILKYANYLSERPELLTQLLGLRGCLLLCWCHTVDYRDRGDLETPCHADLLAWLINGTGPEVTREDAPRFFAQVLSHWPHHFPGQEAWLLHGLAGEVRAAAGIPEGRPLLGRVGPGGPPPSPVEANGA